MMAGACSTLLAGACGPRPGGAFVQSGAAEESPHESGGNAKTAKKIAPRIHAKGKPKTVARPAKPMNLAEAQRYVVALVNRDRQAEGLEPVAWEDAAARSGAEHAADMASHGYTGHWGTDGSVPEHRYTRAGGTGMVQENAACFFDNKDRPLDPNARYTAEALERIESAFMDEKPPHDGHRRNILTAWHNRLGVGLAQPVGIDVPCMAQEFTDSYGSYASLPAKGKLGQTLHVAGTLEAPATFAAVGVARIARPSPMTAADLNKTHTYPVPQPFATYFPKGYVTPLPVHVDGAKFSIDLPLSSSEGPGLYEISVWGEVPETRDLVMVSLRTMLVE